MLVTVPQGYRSRHWNSIDTGNSSTLLPGLGSWTGTAYPAANTATYVPVRVRYAAVVRKLWVAGAATGTGNFDVGLYDAGGTRLASAGSTAKTAAADEIVVDVTDTTIGRGLYYIALNASNNTDTYSAVAPAAPICASMGVLTEAVGAVTLPATATWAQDQTNAFFPLMGMFLEATPV